MTEFYDRYKVRLGTQQEMQLKAFLRDNLAALKSGLSELFNDKLPNWRRTYEALPLEKVRTFPFPNASNLVVPIVAIHTDTLLARLMASIFKTSPLWVAKVVGDHQGQGEDLRLALETFLGHVAEEPKELDLYRVYREWIGSSIKYGTSCLKSPWIRKEISKVIPVLGDDMRARPDFVTEIVYDGPRPDVIQFEDFWISPGATSIDCPFKAHRSRMQKFALQELRFLRVFEPDKVDSIIKFPDRSGPDIAQTSRETDMGARTVNGYGYSEWDVYECWFYYWLPSGKGDHKLVKLVAWYHWRSDTILRLIYSPYPTDPFILNRFFYRDGSIFGYGFTDMLGMFQEEVSVQHNQRNDARTVAMAAAWRVDPNSALHKGYQIYPSAMLPAKAGEIEPLKFGEPSGVSIDDERLVLELAERRSGISPPTQGMGAGVFNKRGVYSSMGTMSLLQEGNTRTDLNIMDIRNAHTLAGRMFLEQYASFGLESLEQRFAKFGSMAQTLRDALRAYLEEAIALPIISSTASVNREVEKQTDVMLVNIMTRHYQMIQQMLGALDNPAVPPSVKEYTVLAIKAADELMKTVVRHFGHDEPMRLVPELNRQGVEQNGGNGAGASIQPGVGQPQIGPGMVQAGGRPALPAMVPNVAQLPAGNLGPVQ